MLQDRTREWQWAIVCCATWSPLFCWRKASSTRRAVRQEWSIISQPRYTDRLLISYWLVCYRYHNHYQSFVILYSVLKCNQTSSFMCYLYVFVFDEVWCGKCVLKVEWMGCWNNRARLRGEWTDKCSSVQDPWLSLYCSNSTTLFISLKGCFGLTIDLWVCVPLWKCHPCSL